MLGCDLCELLQNLSGKNDLVAQLDTCDIFRSPFADRWPGALMVVFREHVDAFSELRLPHLAHANVLMVERAIVRAIGPLRVNAINCSNTREHLHCHLIPRFDGESFPGKNPWELAEIGFDQIHQKSGGAAWLLSKRSDVEETLRRELDRERVAPLPGFFSCAFFLRPTDRATWSRFRDFSLSEITAAARARPEEWETLLMRRNYADFSWDTIGGRSDCGEFPLQTLEREVEEEVGWKISRSLEVARQWQAGVPRGFIFLALPEGDSIFLEKIPVKDREVAEFGFHRLEDLRHPPFPERIRARVEALLSGVSDFSVSNSGSRMQSSV